MGKKPSDLKDEYGDLTLDTQHALDEFLRVVDRIHGDPDVLEARNRVASLKAELAGAEFALEKSLDPYRRNMLDARKTLEEVSHRDGAGWMAKGIVAQGVEGYYRTTYDASALNALAESGNKQFEFLKKHRRQSWVNPRYAFVDQRDPSSIANLPLWKE